MSPLEAGVRAACVAMGISPECWREFAEIGRVCADAYVKALPADIQAQIAAHLAALD